MGPPRGISVEATAAAAISLKESSAPLFRIDERRDSSSRCLFGTTDGEELRGADGESMTFELIDTDLRTDARFAGCCSAGSLSLVSTGDGDGDGVGNCTGNCGGDGGGGGGVGVAAVAGASEGEVEDGAGAEAEAEAAGGLFGCFAPPPPMQPPPPSLLLEPPILATRR